MHYEGNVIRPPSEANSIILQVTSGCSHNSCMFCGAYRDKQFRIKEENIVDQDIDFAARFCKRQKTLFLADGNALVIPQDQLVSLLEKIRYKLPFVRRVSLYANARDILQKSTEELQKLKELGVKRIYMGLETGHDPTLKAIAKGDDAQTIIKAGKIARDIGFFLSVTILLGIAGKEHSQAHALVTAEALNDMQPSQAAVLTLMLLENTPLARKCESGTFVMPNQRELFLELRTLLQHLDLQRSQFQANHASNYFILDGRLPKDKEKFLSFVNDALLGKIHLKSESCRAL